MPRARSRSSRRASPAPSRASASSSRAAWVGARGELLLGHAEAHPERDETRLCAVVQVALDPAQLGVLYVHRARAAALERRDPLPQRGMVGRSR